MMAGASRQVKQLLFGLGLAVAFRSVSEARANPRPTRAQHSASQRTKPATGAERRQTWRSTRADVKSRFRALGRSFKRSK
jgi:hypothetical protein